MPKNRDYESLAAALHLEPTFKSAEDVIKKDYPLKLPSRRYLHIWNSPELGEFRGIKEEIDNEEERRRVIRIETEEIRQVAREQSVPTPDMDFVHQAMQQQRQASDAMAQNMANLNEITRQQQESQHQEAMARMGLLGEEMLRQSRRTEMAEAALRDLRDRHEEERLRLLELAARQGVVHNTIDQSVHHHTTTQNTTMHDQNIHNMTLSILQQNAGQFAAYANQQRMSNEAMYELLREHLRRQHQERQDQTPNIIYNIQQQFQPPPMANPVLAISDSGGPPPPPDAGVRSN